jgi:hypothetical protein
MDPGYLELPIAELPGWRQLEIAANKFIKIIRNSHYFSGYKFNDYFQESSFAIIDIYLIDSHQTTGKSSASLIRLHFGVLIIYSLGRPSRCRSGI